MKVEAMGYETQRIWRDGAGEGNRTLVISLGSWSNAIIRHPLSGQTLYQKCTAI